MTITIRSSDNDDDRPAKKKNRREAEKQFFIPYQPPDFNRERGFDIFHLVSLFVK